MNNGTARTMRVLHVVASLKPTADSVGMVLPGMFRALDAAGCESSVLTGDDSVFENLHATVATVQSPSARVHLESADVVHFHGAEPRWLTSLPDALLRNARPRVISPHGHWCPNDYDAVDRRKQRTIASLQKQLINDKCLIATGNDAETEWMQAHLPAANACLLPYGIDRASTESITATRDDERRYLLLAAPVHPIEGIVPLLRTVAELGYAHRQWHVVLMGAKTGDWMMQIQAALERKGFTDRATIVADPINETQKEWFQQASLLVAPSLRVRASFSVLHAIANRIPAIAVRHAVPGLAEEFVQICSASRQGLRAALNNAMDRTDEELRQSAIDAFERTIDQLDWSRVAAQYMKVYESLVRVS